MHKRGEANASHNGRELKHGILKTGMVAGSGVIGGADIRCGHEDAGQAVDILAAAPLVSATSLGEALDRAATHDRARGR